MSISVLFATLQYLMCILIKGANNSGVHSMWFTLRMSKHRCTWVVLCVKVAELAWAVIIRISLQFSFIIANTQAFLFSSVTTRSLSHLISPSATEPWSSLSISHLSSGTVSFISLPVNCITFMQWKMYSIRGNPGFVYAHCRKNIKGSILAITIQWRRFVHLFGMVVSTVCEICYSVALSEKHLCSKRMSHRCVYLDNNKWNGLHKCYDNVIFR